MIRTIPTGDLGLDVLLGGGWRLVERLPGRESASVVLRGGPGAGKTLLAIDVALALATALEGDVVVACVEMLPSEYVAQIETGRGELVLKWREGPPAEIPRVVTLPATEPIGEAGAPRLFCGLLAEIEAPEPDLVAALEALHREVRGLGGQPAVVVIDSLIGGYGLGSTVPRSRVDALMKYGAREGVAIVLCEEAVDDDPSYWDFAADTVLALEHRRAEGRQILVQKHRYGPSASGIHALEITGWRQPRVVPRLDAWLGKHWMQATLYAHGWRYVDGTGPPRLRWIDEIGPTYGSDERKRPSFDGSLVLISCADLGVARRVAFGLLPEGEERRRDLVIELDPLGLRQDGWSSKNVDVHFLPTSFGSGAAVCALVEYLGERLFTDEDSRRPRRIVMGDFAAVVASANPTEWAEAIRVIAALVAESGWGIPMVVYTTTQATALAPLRGSADLVVDITVHETAAASGLVTARPAGVQRSWVWNPRILAEGAWPEEIAELAVLPRPRWR